MLIFLRTGVPWLLFLGLGFFLFVSLTCIVHRVKTSKATPRFVVRMLWTACIVCFIAGYLIAASWHSPLQYGRRVASRGDIDLAIETYLLAIHQSANVRGSGASDFIKAIADTEGPRSQEVLRGLLEYDTGDLHAPHIRACSARELARKIGQVALPDIKEALVKEKVGFVLEEMKKVIADLENTEAEL